MDTSQYEHGDSRTGSHNWQDWKASAINPDLANTAQKSASVEVLLLERANRFMTKDTTWVVPYKESPTDDIEVSSGWKAQSLLPNGDLRMVKKIVDRVEIVYDVSVDELESWNQQVSDADSDAYVAYFEEQSGRTNKKKESSPISKEELKSKRAEFLFDIGKAVNIYNPKTKMYEPDWIVTGQEGDIVLVSKVPDKERNVRLSVPLSFRSGELVNWNSDSKYKRNSRLQAA